MIVDGDTKPPDDDTDGSSAQGVRQAIASEPSSLAGRNQILLSAS